MEERDESETDGTEIDDILDEVQGLEKEVIESESDQVYSETEDVGCYFTEDDIPSDLEMGDEEVFYVGTGVQEDPVQIN